MTKKEGRALKVGKYSFIAFLVNHFIFFVFLRSNIFKVTVHRSEVNEKYVNIQTSKKIELGNQTNKYTDRMTGKRKKVCDTKKNL